MIRGALLTMTGMLAAAGCTLMPEYRPPALPVANHFSDAPGETVQPAAPPASDIGWRDFFGDERLHRLIAMALDSNRDLRIAVLNVEKSRAQYRIQRADLLPQVQASGNENVAHTPPELTTPGFPSTTHEYSASVGFNAYEIDLFGRLRSLNAQALETYLASEADQRSTQLTVVSEVASDYLNLAADRELLTLARETLRSQTESYALIVRQAALGYASDLAVRQARSPVDTARFDEARYTSQIAQDRNALEMLIGQSIPEALLPMNLNETLQALALKGQLPAGLPSELLQRRPDILEAEHNLRAANANIGAARAAFYPSLTLTASGGTETIELSELFKAGTGVWSFAPQISIPLFAGGRNRANLDSAKASRQIDVAKYEQAVQTGFREVSDALAQRAQYGQQLAAQESLVQATADARRLSEARYSHGIDTYLAVLDAQRSLYSAQQTLISTQLAQAANLVTLYKALGGGIREKTASAT